MAREFTFVLALDGILDDDQVDALFESGLDDVGVERDPAHGRTLIDMTRDAQDLFDAVVVAIRAVESVGARVSNLVAVAGNDDAMLVAVDLIVRARAAMPPLAAEQRQHAAELLLAG